jgi:hypothetical protein
MALRTATAPAKYSYPFLECDEHSGPQMSYIVCKHVLAGAAPAHIYECSSKEPGEMLCSFCISHRDKKLDDCELICAGHAARYLRKVRQVTQ